jgi:hypothetical protein
MHTWRRGGLGCSVSRCSISSLSASICV